MLENILFAVVAIGLMSEQKISRADFHPSYYSARNFWPFNSNTKLKDIRTNKSAVLFGRWKSVNFPGPGSGYLQSKGKAHLNMGDYKGQCLAEPQRCNPALTVSLWFKYPSSSNYKKQVYLGTAALAENSQGFALYMDPVDKKTSKFVVKVSDNKTIWQCEFNQRPNIWAHIGFVWKAKTGLVLYKDCRVTCTNTSGISVITPTSTPVRRNPDAFNFFVGRGNGLGVFKDVSASFDDLAVWYQKLRVKEMAGDICRYKLEPPQIYPTCMSTLTSLRIDWTLPVYTYDMLRGTRVHTRKLFDNNWKTRDVVSTDITSMNFTDLEPFSYHEFRVENKLTQGYGRMGKRIVCRATDASRSLNLTLASETTDSLNLRWYPPKEGQNMVQQYMIKYKMNGTWDDFRIHDVGQSVTKEIRNLLPNSEYIVQVIAIGKTSLKPIAAVEKFFRTSKIVLGRPSELKEAGRSSTAVLIKWSPPTKHTYKVKGYEIKYREKDTTKRMTSLYVGDVTSFLITDLKVNTKYEVQLISLGDDQVLPSPPRSKTIRTDVDDSLTARNRKAYPLSLDTVTVTWEPPAKQFKLFKYRVYLKWKSQGRWYCKKVCYNVNLPNCTASLKNIPAPQSIFILSWITKDVTPLPVTSPVRNVTVTQTLWNSITVSWKEPVIAKGQRFSFLKYEVYLKHENKVVENRTTTKTKLKLKSLQEKNHYVLRIRAANPVSKGPFSSEIRFTTPARDYCTPKNVCHSDAMCISTPGSFLCKCKEGYAGDGLTCVVLPPDVTNKEFCKSEDRAGVFWTKTFRGTSIRNVCPGGCRGEASRKCRKTKNGGASWSVPDLSNCVSPWMEDIQTQLQTKNVDTSLVASKLVNLTHTSLGRKVYTGDLLVLVKSVGVLASKGFKNGKNANRTDQSTAFSKMLFLTASNILDSTYLETWRYMPQVSRATSAGDLIRSLDAVSLELVSRVDDTEAATPNIDMKVRSLQNKTKRKPLTIRDGNTEARGSTVTFPESVIGPQDDGKEAPRYLTYVNFKSIGSLMEPSSAKSSKSVSSPVVSLNLNPLEKKRFLKPVKLILRHAEDEEKTLPSCVFWNTSRSPGFWSDEGCEVYRTNMTHTECHCYHLTCFAVLMAVDNEAVAAIKGKHLVALSLITYIGIGLSVVCLVLAFLTFLTFRFLKSTRTFIHLNLSISLALADLVFMFGINKTENEVLCKVVAIALHYLFLVAFAWMALEGVVLYLMLVKVFEPKKATVKNNKVFFACAWLIPAIAVVVSGAINYEGYGTDNYCWLSLNKGFIWAFVGPVLAIVAFNFVVLGITFSVMARRGSYKNKDSLDKIRYWAKGATLLTCILGLTWMFGVFFINGISIFMAYFFTIFSALQGVFIFVFHCICDVKIRREYKRILCCRGKQGEYLLTKGSSSRTDTFAKAGSAKEEPLRSPKTLNSTVYKPTVLVGNGTNGRVMIYGDENENAKENKPDANEDLENGNDNSENLRNSLLNKNGIELMRLTGAE